MEIDYLFALVAGGLGTLWFGHHKWYEGVRRELDDVGARKRWARRLTAGQFLPLLTDRHYGAADYRKFLARVLDRLDELQGPVFHIAGLGFCLSLSFIYSTLFLVATWLSGSGLETPGLSLLPSGWIGWQRLLWASSLVFSSALLYWGAKKETRESTASSSVAVNQVVFLTNADRHVLSQLGWLFNFTMTAHGAAAVGAICGFMVIAAATGLIAVTAAVVVVVLTVSIGGVVAVSVSVIVGVGFLLAFNGDDSIAPVNVLGAVCALFFLLPIFNALIDWPSWIVSRWLMRHLTELGEPVQDSPLNVLGLLGLHTLVDLLAALVFLVALVGLMPVAFVWVSGRLAIEYPVAIVIRQAADDPWGAGLWISLMLLSTLVPTLLHIIAMLGFAVVCQFPESVRKRHIELLELDAPGPDQLNVVARFLTRRFAIGLTAACLTVAGLATPAWWAFRPIGGWLKELALWSAKLYAT